MNEEFPDLEAPNLDFPNDNLAVAYEFFLNYYLHPYDIAVELFDFPDVIKNPFDNEEISKAAKKNLVTKKNVENFVLLKILDRKYREFAETRSIEVTEPKAAIEHYLFPDRVLEVSGIDFINEVKRLTNGKVAQYLCAYFLNINLSKQAYKDGNYLSSNMLYHMALSNLIQLKLLLGKDLLLDVNGIYHNISKVNGGKGGKKKADKKEGVKKKFLEYHDKHCSMINKSGKYHFSPPKAAEKILNEIGNSDENGKYEFEVNSLANIIRQHRKSLKS